MFALQYRLEKVAKDDDEYTFLLDQLNGYNKLHVDSYQRVVRIHGEREGSLGLQEECLIFSSLLAGPCPQRVFEVAVPPLHFRLVSLRSWGAIVAHPRVSGPFFYGSEGWTNSRGLRAKLTWLLEH